VVRKDRIFDEHSFLYRDLNSIHKRINANEAMVASTVGSGGVSVWRECGVGRSVLYWCIWQESGFILREDVFIFFVFTLKRSFINCVLSMRFTKIKLQ
jgi:hypothetical protein